MSDGETSRVRSASLTNVGRVRRENQDAHGELVTQSGERLWIVADGMGGHLGGATASRICVETLRETFASTDESLSRRLELGLASANKRIRDAAESQAELAGMGTTAVALCFGSDSQGALAWVGDSRAYRLRGDALEALSSDHSLVAEWVRAGVLRAEEADRHPRRNELLRALGAAEKVEPGVTRLELRAGDRFLLCSDGLSAVVPLEQIASILRSESPELAVRKLVALANQLGGPDNVTAVVADVPADPRPSRVTRSSGPFAAFAAFVARLRSGARPRQ